MNLRKLGRGLRKGLAAIASVGPSLLQVLGIKKGTMAGKAVEAAAAVEKVAEIIESPQRPPP